MKLGRVCTDVPGPEVGNRIRAQLLRTSAAGMRAQREDAEDQAERGCGPMERYLAYPDMRLGLEASQCLSSFLIAVRKKLQDSYGGCLCVTLTSPKDHYSAP